MRRYVFGFAMLAVAACSPVIVRADQQQDKQIAQQVMQRLQQEKEAGRLKGFSIDLQVEEGTLWLSGRVPTKEQQTTALEAARRIPGVKQVVNDLTVTGAKPVSTVSKSTSIPVSTMKETPEPTVMRTSGAAAAPAQRGAGPVAFSSARTVAHAQAINAGGPQPMMMPSSGMGVAPARYDHPNMPSYAWPSYASHPNYAAVTYPKQYSPTAWPYIGPFYPYPQVPLGWRKVSLEWDDGWWMLDFKDRH